MVRLSCWILVGITCLLVVSCNRPTVPGSPNGESRQAAANPTRSGDNPINLAYTVTIPQNVQGMVTLFGKSPDHDRNVDCRELYQQWHRHGWDECVFRFATSGAGEKARFVRWDDFGLALVDLKADYGPMLKQYTGYEQDADRAGFSECLSAIRSLAERYGQEEVRAALRVQYEAEKNRPARKK